MIDTILCGDVRSCLKQLEDGSVQCVITSPPYWGLRDYGTATWEGGDPNCDHRFRDDKRDVTSTLVGTSNKEGFALNCYKDICGKCGARRIDSQIGLEPTPEAYVADLVEVFREVKRVLRNDGVLWLNLGDSYAGSGKGDNPNGKQGTNAGTRFDSPTSGMVPIGLKPKDLVGIPWMVAFALRADGWYLRSDIIWNKPNPMPESVTDRCTKSHEYIFMLTKSERYYYDAESIKEPSSCLGETKIRFGGSKYGDNDDPAYATKSGNEYTDSGFRNKRDVWTVATQPCAEAHFATFPPKLIEPMILAGTSEKGCCPKCGKPWERITEPLIEAKHTGDTESAYPEGTTANRLALLRQAAREQGVEYTGARKTVGWQPGCYCGTERRIPKEELKADPSLMGPVIRPFDPVPCTILDPFMGSGTTAIQAVRWHRHYLGCELNPEYVKMAERRINDMVGPLFEVTV